LIQINLHRLCDFAYGPDRPPAGESLRADMSSLDIVASPAIRRDETVPIALLLAFTGGYLDAYTWIIHGVMANAQTANLVLLWVYGTAGEWSRAAHFFLRSRHSPSALSLRHGCVAPEETGPAQSARWLRSCCR